MPSFVRVAETWLVMGPPCPSLAIGLTSEIAEMHGRCLPQPDLQAFKALKANAPPPACLGDDSWFMDDDSYGMFHHEKKLVECPTRVTEL